MAREILAFNRGRVSPLALARQDIPRIALSAETMTNWMPRTLGSMMLRPGTKHIGVTAGPTTDKAYMIPFVFGATDVAIIELTDSLMRVWIDDVVLTRPGVSSAVTNGTFDSDLTNWADNDDAGAASAWSANESNSLELTSTATAVASRTQTMTVAGGDQNVEHAFRVDVRARPIVLRVGSSSGEADYIDATLKPGLHSLAFTPTGASVYIDIRNRLARFIEVANVTAIEVESSGIVTIATQWPEANIPDVRYDQSADVLFCACEGVKPQRIERRGTGRSWSIVDYFPEDGPFLQENFSQITMTGDGSSLTASQPYFTPGNIGSVFEVNYPGQSVDVTVTAENQFSNSISIAGTGSMREFDLVITGTFVATIEFQRSYDDATWTKVARYVGAGTLTFDDGLDNQEVFYRIGCKTGDYTSGTAVCDLTAATSSLRALCEVTAYTSPTVVTCTSLNRAFDDVASGITTVWAEGAWSDRRSFPTSVALHEGRLWLAAGGTLWGSISDAFEAFDSTLVGDAGPITRSIGNGPIDVAPWLLSLERLAVGTASAEWTASSGTLGEPMSPTAFKITSGSSQGVDAVAAERIDHRGIFVQQSGIRLYELFMDPESAMHRSIDLTALVPEIGEPGIARMAVQRKPDTRVHCVRTDGSVGILIYDPAENVICWLDIVIGGTSVVVEDVAVLPGAEEDRVYYTVKRTIDGATARHLEKWALESDCKGPLEVQCSDAHLIYNGAAVTTITGLSHLEGESVEVWGWDTGTPLTVTMPDGTTKNVGKDLGTFTVSSGQITGLSESITDAVVGLAYSASYVGAMEGPLARKKKIGELGLVLRDSHVQGLTYGDRTTDMQNMPLNHKGATLDANTIFAEYETDGLEIPGFWDYDGRLALVGASPRPCTVVAAVIDFPEDEEQAA
tara:strand:- start:1589 stop:4312 length:2724 start_codon:yes stop_codon:yes gene_type:complete